MNNLTTTEKSNNNNNPSKTLMSASSSEMLDKSTTELSDQKVGAVSSSSFEESSSSDNEDKKSTTSGASSDLSIEKEKTENRRNNQVVVQFGTQWMESSSNQTSSGNEEELIQFNPMVSRGSSSNKNNLNRSDSAVSKSSGKSLDSTISKSSLPISEGDNYHHAKIDSTTSPRDSIFSSSGSPPQILQNTNKEQQQLNETDLLLYNECYTQVLRQLRRRREDDMKRARRTLEESQWLLDLLWKATNVQKKFSRHNSITSELETVQEELEQARQVFLGRQKLKSVERKSSFSKPKFSNQKPTKSVVFNRKVAVSQPSNLQVVPSNKNDQSVKPETTSLRPPSFSTTSLDTKYKASGGLNAPKTERTALIGKIIETAVKIDEKEAKLNNTPRRLANNDRLIIKLKIMLSKKWSKDGEPITWTRLADNSVYDV